MKNIVAFGASSSTQSINKQLANYTAYRLKNTEVNLLDLNDFEMPIFNVDREKESGIPDLALAFKKHIENSDGIIISFAEHNGAYSAAFKNIFDWISRIGKDVWANKPMFLMATSPGGRGGQTVLDIAVKKFKFMNPNTQVSFSLPSFHKNFSHENGIVDEELRNKFEKQLSQFEAAVAESKSPANA